MIEFIFEIPLNRRITGLTGLFNKKPETSIHYENIFYEFIAWGDPIEDDGFRQRLERNNSLEFIVNNLYGHYYFIYLIKNTEELFVGSSLFSILPLYYHYNKGKITISENALILGNYIHSDIICKRFILETVLFNYPLFNNSILQDIHLLNSNSYISVSQGKLSIRKHTSIEDLFQDNPDPWRKSLGKMTEKFLETVEKYLPSKHYATSLTGGFDGRTLVSAGLYHKKDFATYSFGTETSKDLTIAKALSAKADLPFLKIELGEDYAVQKSLECGREFIMNASGTATFARAHYLHAAKQLAGETDIIITGNFGSEIFRAAHIAGVMISANLYSIFNLGSPGEAFKAIETSSEYRFLNKETFKTEWESLKSDILQLSCYNPHYSGLTQNQRFYVFVFEELFRKYFGAELINQFKYLKNRTPFLDIDFLKAIFRTELAGIHSGFFEHNPLKRYKGQVLYARIIRKAFPALGTIITDKGYKPDDLISFSGKLNIAEGYFKKITNRGYSSSDPNGVQEAWEMNRPYWDSIPVSSEYFNVTELSHFDKEILFKILSLSYIKNL